MKKLLKNALRAFDIRDAIECDHQIRFIILCMIYIFVIVCVNTVLYALAKVYPVFYIIYFVVASPFVLFPFIDRIRKLNEENDDDSP